MANRPGRPRQRLCKRGHNLNEESNVRWIEVRRHTGGKRKKYTVRVCRLCEHARRHEAREKEKTGE